MDSQFVFNHLFKLYVTTIDMNVLLWPKAEWRVWPKAEWRVWNLRES